MNKHSEILKELNKIEVEKGPSMKNYDPFAEDETIKKYRKENNMWAWIITKIPLLFPIVITGIVWLMKRLMRVFVGKLSPTVLSVVSAEKTDKGLIITVNVDEINKVASETPNKYDDHFTDVVYAGADELWKLKNS